MSVHAPARPPATSPGIPPGAGLAANLVAGLALARGRPVAPGAFACSLGQLLAALAVLVAGAVLADRLAAGAEAEFWAWGLVSQSARLQVWLAAAAVVAWLSRREGAFVLLVTALVWAWLPIWAAAGALANLGAALGAPLSGDAGTAFSAGVTLWLVLVFWRALGLVGPLPARRAVFATGVFALALTVNTKSLPDADVFYRPVAYEAPSLDIEAVYYRQRELLEDALGALEPGVPGRPDLFFVGVGAYAAEDVFMREVRQVRELFERELGATGRALSLINNPETVWTTPLANRYNLADALTHIASLMNDEDVLFLFVTSHGNDDATVAVDFQPLGLNDIDAATLRAALDDAGIRWRVVVISACYSGSFIEALASPETLVITAAAHDRASFGCAHENAWTYFGRAYFDEALRETTDFVEAFTLAAASVEIREAAEDRTPSRPQIRTGAAIRAHLAGRPTAQPASACCAATD